MKAVIFWKVAREANGQEAVTVKTIAVVAEVEILAATEISESAVKATKWTDRFLRPDLEEMRKIEN